MKSLTYVYIIILFILGYFLYYQHIIIDNYKNCQYDTKIDSLQNVLDGIKIDTVFIKEYESKRDSINQKIKQEWIDMSKFSDAEHVEFFTNYIQRFSENNQGLTSVDSYQTD